MAPTPTDANEIGRRQYIYLVYTSYTFSISKELTLPNTQRNEDILLHERHCPASYSTITSVIFDYEMFRTEHAGVLNR
jgi:hypothetical protein